MSQKTKIAGWIAVGALAGALTTVSLQTVARGTLAPLPLQELQQLAAVFSMIKTDYVEPVDEKKLITDAISGMVAGLDPHSQYFDKKSYKEFREGTTGRFVGVGIEITQEDGLIKVVSPVLVSMLATMTVSVRVPVRPFPASPPSSKMFNRGFLAHGSAEG